MDVDGAGEGQGSCWMTVVSNGDGAGWNGSER